MLLKLGMTAKWHAAGSCSAPNARNRTSRQKNQMNSNSTPFATSPINTRIQPIHVGATQDSGLAGYRRRLVHGPFNDRRKERFHWGLCESDARTLQRQGISVDADCGLFGVVRRQRQTNPCGQDRLQRLLEVADQRLWPLVRQRSGKPEGRLRVAKFNLEASVLSKAFQAGPGRDDIACGLKSLSSQTATV